MQNSSSKVLTLDEYINHFHVVCVHKRVIQRMNIVQVVGACYYLLGIQRSGRCLMEQCLKTESCRLNALSCDNPFFFGSAYKVTDNMRMAWGNNNDARSWCLQSSNNSQYDYGSFEWITLLICNSNRTEKMLLPLFWGVMMLWLLLYLLVLFLFLLFLFLI